MIRGYVLVQTRVAMGPQVALELGRVPGVLSAEGVTGPYDVIVRVEAPDLDELGRRVAVGVHGVDGITRTITCIRASSRS